MCVITNVCASTTQWSELENHRQLIYSGKSDSFHCSGSNEPTHNNNSISHIICNQVQQMHQSSSSFACFSKTCFEHKGFATSTLNLSSLFLPDVDRERAPRGLRNRFPRNLNGTVYIRKQMVSCLATISTDLICPQHAIRLPQNAKFVVAPRLWPKWR